MQVLWIKSDQIIDYQKSLEKMQYLFEAISNNHLPDTIFIFTCKPTYTYTKNCIDTELNFFHPSNLPLIQTQRGGNITYHGPGQRVVYPIINLHNYKKDIKWYVQMLQQWIVNSLKNINIPAYTCEKIGVWASNKQNVEGKIASIGVKVKKWITQYGFCINIFENDLKNFNYITPCGIKDSTMLSCDMFCKKVSMSLIDESLEKNFSSTFKITK